jgi:hypothetical protein
MEINESKVFEAIMVAVRKMPEQSNMASHSAQVLLAKRIIDELV